MKKLFALFMVVAMLSIAGTAMAADTTLTASRSKLSMTAGGTETVTLTATAGHGGQLSAITVSGASWATVSGNTLILAPTAAGTYTLNAAVTETYTEGDAAGHATPVTVTSTANASIAVSVVARTAGTVIVTRVVEVVVEVTRTVTVISSSARRAAVVQTFTETIRSVSQVITVAVLTTGSAAYSPRLAQVWTRKAQQVETARSVTVSAIANDPVRAARVFNFGSSASSMVLTPRSNSSLVSVKSTTTSTMTVTEKLAIMTEMLGGAGKALSAQEAVQPQESGTYSFIKTFGKELYGTKIAGHNGKRSRVSASSFSAAAADNSGVAFLNSSGDVVDAIPDDSQSEDIMPGYVTMLVVMVAGETYEPVVYATDDALKDAGVSVDSTPTTVTYEEVTEKEEKVAVVVKEDGTVEETVISVDPDDPKVAAATSNMNKVMAAAMGTSVDVKSAAEYAGSGVAAATITTEDELAESTDMFIAARPGIAYNELPDGAYYMPMNFKGLPEGVALKSAAKFVFWPDGIADGTVAFSKVSLTSGDEVTNPMDLLADEENGTDAYVAFVIENSGIRTADTNNSLTNPTVTIELASTAPVSPDTRPTSPDTRPTSPDTRPTSPDVRNPIGAGSSSGGCSAGSAVLALALLGTFIASRKK